MVSSMFRPLSSSSTGASSLSSTQPSSLQPDSSAQAVEQRVSLITIEDGIEAAPPSYRSLSPNSSRSENTIASPHDLSSSRGVGSFEAAQSQCSPPSNLPRPHRRDFSAIKEKAVVRAEQLRENELFKEKRKALKQADSLINFRSTRSTKKYTSEFFPHSSKTEKRLIECLRLSADVIGTLHRHRLTLSPAKVSAIQQSWLRLVRDVITWRFVSALDETSKSLQLDLRPSEFEMTCFCINRLASVSLDFNKEVQATLDRGIQEEARKAVIKGEVYKIKICERADTGRLFNPVYFEGYINSRQFDRLGLISEITGEEVSSWSRMRTSLSQRFQ